MIWPIQKWARLQFYPICRSSIGATIIIQSMSKHFNGAPKNYKSTELIRFFPNSPLASYFRVPPSNPSAGPAMFKFPKENPIIRVPKIQRHYSEQDFKKHQMNCMVEPVEIPVKVEDQYFVSSNSPAKKEVNPVRSTEKARKTSEKLHNTQKVISENIGAKFTGLKETSSTQSTENLKTLPFFKSKNNLYQRPLELSQKKTPSMKNIISPENFKIINKIGEGKFGKVFLVKQINTGFVLAMKIIEKKKIIKQRLLQQFIRQLKIQSFFNHPHIISLYGFFTDDSNFYTLMELGCDGQLYNVISNNKKLSQESTSFIVKSLLDAIGHMHGSKVLHRDIKPENIVLVMGNVKVCDFGWAVNKLSAEDLRNTFCGTPLYLSPEILQGNRYDEKVDLWAVGVLAFELLLGCSPFDINDPNDLYKITTETVSYPKNKQVSSEFRNFISAILNKNPEKRPNSKQLLNMDFIIKYKDLETCEELCK